MEIRRPERPGEAMRRLSLTLFTRDHVDVSEEIRYMSSIASRKIAAEVKNASTSGRFFFLDLGGCSTQLENFGKGRDFACLTGLGRYSAYNEVPTHNVSDLW
jgi:hypothetical protein